LSIRLYILGTLAKENNHPYRIKKKLVQLLPTNKLSEGKFYYNFEVLQNKGYIEAVEVIQDGKRPEKTLYTITNAGREFLEKGIYDSFKKSIKVQDLYISIYLLEFVDPRKVVEILEASIDKEKKRWGDLQKQKEEHPFKEQFEELNEQMKSSVNFIADHAFSNAKFNIEWLEKFLELVKSKY
jgi:DNA-binding PadR family transcriptional regulator